VCAHPELGFRLLAGSLGPADSSERFARAPGLVLDHVFEGKDEAAHGVRAAGSTGAGAERGKIRTYDEGEG
jgi:hypothetical protein